LSLINAWDDQLSEQQLSFLSDFVLCSYLLVHSNNKDWIGLGRAYGDCMAPDGRSWVRVYAVNSVIQVTKER